MPFVSLLCLCINCAVYVLPPKSKSTGRAVSTTTVTDGRCIGGGDCVLILCPILVNDKMTGKHKSMCI